MFCNYFSQGKNSLNLIEVKCVSPIYIYISHLLLFSIKYYIGQSYFQKTLDITNYLNYFLLKKHERQINV